MPTTPNNVYTQLVCHASCILESILIENGKTFNFKEVSDMYHKIVYIKMS